MRVLFIAVLALCIVNMQSTLHRHGLRLFGRSDGRQYASGAPLVAGSGLASHTCPVCQRAFSRPCAMHSHLRHALGQVVEEEVAPGDLIDRFPDSLAPAIAGAFLVLGGQNWTLDFLSSLAVYPLLAPKWCQMMKKLHNKRRQENVPPRSANFQISRLPDY